MKWKSEIVIFGKSERAKKELSSSLARTNASADQLEKEIREVNQAKEKIDEREIEIEREKAFEKQMEENTTALKERLEQLEVKVF